MTGYMNTARTLVLRWFRNVLGFVVVAIDMNIIITIYKVTVGSANRTTTFVLLISIILIASCDTSRLFLFFIIAAF
jgi:hypothetical protein